MRVPFRAVAPLAAALAALGAGSAVALPGTTPQAGSRALSAAGGARLLVPPSSLSCAEYQAHGVVAGVRFAPVSDVRHRGRGASAQLLKADSTRHYAQARWRPDGPNGDRQWYYHPLRGRGCGAAYDVRYSVLVGPKGTPHSAHRYGPYRVTIEPPAP